MQTWKTSIFRRLLVTFLLIMIPIYIFGLAIYYWGINAIRDEISNSMDAQVSSYLSNLDAEIQRIQSSQYDALGDENLYTLAAISASMNEYERTKAVLRLQQRLSAIKNSSIYIHDVTAYIPPIGKTISARDAQEDITAEFRSIVAAPVNLASKFNYRNGKLYLIVKFPTFLQYQKNGSVSYAIIIELTNAGLQRALEQLDNKEDGTMLIDAAQKFTFTENGETETSRSIRNEVLAGNAGSLTDPFSMSIDGRKYLVVAKKSEPLGVILTKFVPEDEIFAPVYSYRIWMWVYTVTTILIISVFCVSTYKFIHKPLVKLVRSFKKIEMGDLNIQIDHHRQDEFRYLFQRFNVMVENLNALIDQAYKQKIMAQRAELKQLQSQINPHFLYNSFFILNGMVKAEDYDTLDLFTKQLGNYFQFITRSSASDVPLIQEVTHARTYAQIQAKRFRSRISLDFEELPEPFHQVYVPRLILQPIIENAFEHGLEDKMQGGLLRVRFEASNSRLNIIVEDNGDGLNREGLAAIAGRLGDSAEGAEHTGMINIQKRIQLKFGPGSGVEVSKSGLGGLQVTIIIELGEDDAHVPAIL